MQIMLKLLHRIKSIQTKRTKENKKLSKKISKIASKNDCEKESKKQSNIQSNKPSKIKLLVGTLRNRILIPGIVIVIICTGTFTVGNVLHKERLVKAKSTLGQYEEPFFIHNLYSASKKYAYFKSIVLPKQIKDNFIDKKTLEQEKEIADYLQKADLLAMGYDYDGAIELIKKYKGSYAGHEKLTEAVRKYEDKKKTLDPYGTYTSVDQISHIFFHSLVADNSLAFDGDSDANGYNYYMTTISEFKNMMSQMYEAGYVLVSIHDVGRKITLDDGTTKFVPGEIMLPPDKKPFVLSQDDVNYYDYMDHDGFATRMVIDDKGRPSTAMILEDGSVSVGDYDMVPVLETFIAEHPDFSYKGARGILALTGYEGTLGYRTDKSDSPTFEEDKKTVKEVARVLKEWGWEFASHSYGHRNMLNASYNFIVQDTDRWMKEVGTLIGPTDIFIYPYGVEIETTLETYSSNKYQYLKGLGFDYFCGVYSKPWIQVKEDYVRMTRRPMDGQAMLQFPERLSDLFDLSKVLDPDRPALK